MMKINQLNLMIATTLFSSSMFATDLTGTWQQIDDKTGSPKAVIEIRKESNNTYTGKIVKITPRPGYTPQKLCINCPLPYTNRTILGMDVLTGLQHIEGSNSYEKGKIIDPLSGKIYDSKVRLMNNGKHLTMRGYVGVSAIGRSQTWIRQE